MSNGEAITVDLGDLGPRVWERIESGQYSSPSEVIRAGLEALNREEEIVDDMMRRKVREAYDDPRPSIPAEEVFARLRAHHAERMKARGLET